MLRGGRVLGIRIYITINFLREAAAGHLRLGNVSFFIHPVVKFAGIF